MISRKKWRVEGVATHIKKTKKGWWITVKGTVKHECFSRPMTLDCWLPNLLVDHRRNFFKRFYASGVLNFEKKDCYFLTENLLT